MKERSMNLNKKLKVSALFVAYLCFYRTYADYFGTKQHNYPTERSDNSKIRCRGLTETG
jgi:hypothetical protein